MRFSVTDAKPYLCIVRTILCKVCEKDITVLIMTITLTSVLQWVSHWLDINPYLCNTKNMFSVLKRHRYKWVSHLVSFKVKVDVLHTTLQALKTIWGRARDKKLWLTEEGKLYHEKTSLCISSLCMQTNLNPFDQKHTCFKGYSHFLYLPSPSANPSSPSLVKFSEEVLKMEFLQVLGQKRRFL